MPRKGYSPPLGGLFYFLKMALTTELAIYKQMYALLNHIIDACEHFPKMYKYSFGEKLMMTGIECCELIQNANFTWKEEREFYQRQFSIKFQSLQLILRICRDRRIVNERKFCEMLELAGSIGRQATAWRNQTIEDIKKGQQNYSQNVNRQAD